MSGRTEGGAKELGAAVFCRSIIEETAMATPPFRADIVGSFLRPAAVKAARKAHFEDNTIVGRGAEGDRGRGDHRRHPHAGERRAQGGDRRRVPPRLVALRLHGHARRARYRPARGRRHPVPRHDDQGRCAGHQRAARLSRRSPDAGALQVRRGEHQGDAEDLDPRTERYPFPHRRGRYPRAGVQARRRGLFRGDHPHLQARR